jgi:hypothetical protein
MPCDPVARTARTPENILLFARALCLVAGVRAALSLLPFRVTRRLVTRLAGRRPSASCRPADQLRWAVQAAARRIPGATCLTQALALHILLRRHGHNACLQIGVAPAAGRPFRAHAWIECDNRILLGALPDLHSFSPLPQIPLS